MTTEYWRMEGYADGCAGRPRKTREFFQAAQIVQYYWAYRDAYNQGYRRRIRDGDW